MTTKLLKISKRVAIILLIVVSIVGMISCKNKNITGSAQSSEAPAPTGPTEPTEPEGPQEPEKPTFPEDTYYQIYEPWVEGLSAEDGWVTTVSWQDTDSLTELWRKQIEGGKDNDGKRFIIRDANNNQSDPLTGSYYYFDKDLNIVYYIQGKDSLTVRKFLGSIIAKYGREKYEGTYAIGGVYETVLYKNKITDNNFDQLNIFM